MNAYPKRVPRGATIEERLRHYGWTVTERGCWEWNGPRTSGGYGRLVVAGKHLIVSRVAFQTWRSAVLIDDEVVCHSCDNPPCINPEHLFTGSRGDNQADMKAKGRGNGPRTWGQTKYNHKLTNEQVSEVLTLLAAGTQSQADIARRYGVTRQLIWQIKTGRRRTEDHS